MLLHRLAAEHFILDDGPDDAIRIGESAQEITSMKSGSLGRDLRIGNAATCVSPGFLLRE